MKYLSLDDFIIVEKINKWSEEAIYVSTTSITINKRCQQILQESSGISPEDMGAFEIRLRSSDWTIYLQPCKEEDILANPDTLYRVSRSKETSSLSISIASILKRLHLPKGRYISIPNHPGFFQYVKNNEKSLIYSENELPKTSSGIEYDLELSPKDVSVGDLVVWATQKAGGRRMPAYGEVIELTEQDKISIHNLSNDKNTEIGIENIIKLNKVGKPNA